MPQRRRARWISLPVMALLAGCAPGAAHHTTPANVSGLRVGDDIVPWNPIHVAGPDRGTNACPVCTYEARPAVVIFSKGGANLPALAEQLERLVVRERQRDLKGFIVALDTPAAQLEQMASELKLTHIGVCYPDPEWRDGQLKAYRINPTVDNTVIVYKDYKVTANLVDVAAGEFRKIEAALPR